MKNHRVRTRSAASPPVVESRSHPSEGGVYYQDLIQIYPLDELTILKKPDFSVSPEFHDESLQQSWVMKHLANFYDDNPFRLARVQSDIDAGRPGGIGVMYQKPSGGWKLPENQVGPFSLDPLDLATHWHELRSQTPQSSWEKQSLVRHLRNWDKYAESGEDAAGRGDEKRESALSRKRRLLEVGDKGEGTSKRPRRSRKAAGQNAGDKQAPGVKSAAAILPARGQTQSSAASSGSQALGPTKPDCVIWTGTAQDRLIWMTIEFKYLRMNVGDKRFSEAISHRRHEGVYQAAWYLACIFPLQGSRRGMAVVQDRFVRLYVVNQTEIAIEAGPATECGILLELEALDSMAAYWNDKSWGHEIVSPSDLTFVRSILGVMCAATEYAIDEWASKFSADRLKERYDNEMTRDGPPTHLRFKADDNNLVAAYLKKEKHRKSASSASLSSRARQEESRSGTDSTGQPPARDSRKSLRNLATANKAAKGGATGGGRSGTGNAGGRGQASGGNKGKDKTKQQRIDATGAVVEGDATSPGGLSALYSASSDAERVHQWRHTIGKSPPFAAVPPLSSIDQRRSNPIATDPSLISKRHSITESEAERQQACAVRYSLICGKIKFRLRDTKAMDQLWMVNDRPAQGSSSGRSPKSVALVTPESSP